MSSEIQTILAAGGAGYIGSTLCEVLLNEGYRVICLDQLYFGLEAIAPLLNHRNFLLVHGDIRTVGLDIFKGVDVAIDIAGISNDPASDLDPRITEDINFNGAISFAKLAKKAGVKRYIYSSSCSIYGGGNKGEFAEGSDPNPMTLYAKIKLRVEKQIKELMSDEFCVTALRNATVYGMSRRMRLDLLVNIMTANAVSKGKVFVFNGGGQWRPNIHVRDVSKAFSLVINAPVERVNGEVFNVGCDNQNFQVIQVANMICDVVPYAELEHVANGVDQRDYRVSFGKIRDAVGFRIDHTAVEGAVEVKQAIEKGILNINDIRTSTVKCYQHLMQIGRIMRSVGLGH